MIEKAIECLGGDSMTADQETSATPNPLKRPWHRLHFSTWLMVLLALGVLAILEIPAELPEMIEEKGYGDSYIQEEVVKFHHGWPWHYLDRKLQATQKIDNGFSISTLFFEYLTNPGEAPWLVARSWSFIGKRTFMPLNLFLDFLIAVLIVGAVGFIFERRRRRGLRLWQFTLREFCGLFLLTAAALSYWAVHHRQAEAENRFLLDHDYRVSRYEKKYAGPLILAKLIGTSSLWDFEHICAFDYYPKDISHEERNEQLKKLLPELDRFPCLNSVEMDCYGDFSDADLENLANLRNLEHLSLINDKNTGAWLKIIQRMRGLKYFHLYNNDEPSGGYQGLAELTSLETLELSSRSLDDDKLGFLSSLKELRSLTLDCDLITDDSVMFLGGLNGLKELDICETKITPEGVKKLQALLPDCDILSKETEKALSESPITNSE
jgi:hypothetical protein